MFVFLPSFACYLNFERVATSKQGSTFEKNEIKTSNGKTKNKGFELLSNLCKSRILDRGATLIAITTRRIHKKKEVWKLIK